MKAPFAPWLAMTLIVLIGAVTGAALTIGFRSEWAHPPGPKQMRNHWLGRLNEQLHLTPDQESKIEPILGQAGDQIKKVHQEEVGKIMQILDAADAQIAPLLTADQQAEFARMHRERFHHLHRWGAPGDGPPPPPAEPGPAAGH